ncbi:sigma-70 family RNA polymerase sigma factor [Salinibacterium sp.]|uniref:sigma-70 family RNA polymerase sigma factor n=1 Tax=Salinibacterium sp. TaxID=1915057 RepID=UPI00286C2F7F|nr:sigma-70 family RNA polymerase sigma factor [Salinibacterium sp.]
MTTTTFESTADFGAALLGRPAVSKKSGEASWETTVERLVAERGDSLTRYAYLVSGRRDDASDLVQEALVKTFGRLRNGFTIASAEAYVRRAILNTYLDGGRRLSTWLRIVHLQVTPDVVEGMDAATEARLDLRTQLMRLAPRERACIVLRYYEDLTVNSIADELEISAGAVKRYLSDGLAKMAVSLASDTERELRDNTPDFHQHDHQKGSTRAQ